MNLHVKTFDNKFKKKAQKHLYHLSPFGVWKNSPRWYSMARKPMTSGALCVAALASRGGHSSVPWSKVINPCASVSSPVKQKRWSYYLLHTVEVGAKWQRRWDTSKRIVSAMRINTSHLTLIAACDVWMMTEALSEKSLRTEIFNTWLWTKFNRSGNRF